MKYYRMSFKEITEERSYINIMLLNASIPKYIREDEGKSKKQKKMSFVDALNLL
ncbi:MAG: hypothetical protein UIG52_00725 [Bacteroidales bacterium]|nr:hypothetical protein [Bacteroidales bacterium]